MPKQSPRPDSNTETREQKAVLYSDPTGKHYYSHFILGNNNISGTQYITNDALSLKYQECICSNSQAYSCPSKARGQNRYRAESGKLDHARFVIFPRLSPQPSAPHSILCLQLLCSQYAPSSGVRLSVHFSILKMSLFKLGNVCQYSCSQGPARNQL